VACDTRDDVSFLASTKCIHIVTVWREQSWPWEHGGRLLVSRLTLCRKHTGAGKRRLSLCLRLYWQTFDRRLDYEEPKVKVLHCCNQTTEVATGTHNTHLNFGTICFYLQCTCYCAHTHTHTHTPGGVHHHAVNTSTHNVTCNARFLLRFYEIFKWGEKH